MRKWSRSLEAGLWGLGLLCGGTLLVDRVEVWAAQKSVTALEGSPAEAPRSTASRTEEAPQGFLGRLDIPALRLSTPIVDDDDTPSLLKGAGHIRGTAMPGGLGNFVIAAHRDTYFRPLAGIKPGMEMRVVTPHETYTYIVDATKIVNPEDLEVLDTGEVPQMTLITCYPFHYIGAAPQRFTVTAHLRSF